MRVIPLDPRQPDAALQEAAAVVRAGGVIAFPTETFYGLGVDPYNEAAVKRLYAIKSRSPNKPILILIADAADLLQHVREIPPLARRLMARFWPGPITLLFEPSSNLPRMLLGQTDRIGIRVPGAAHTRRLCELLAGPITGTSANVSGVTSLSDPQAVARALGDRVDLLLDAGPTPGGQPSTVVDVTGGYLKIVREGAVSRKALERALSRET